MGIAKSLQAHGNELASDGVRLRVVAVNGDQANVQVQDLKAQAMDQARLAKLQQPKGKKSRSNVFQEYQQRGHYQRPIYAFPTSTTTTTISSSSSSSEPMEMDDSNLFTNEES
jgi:hypothetical protein